MSENDVQWLQDKLNAMDKRIGDIESGLTERIQQISDSLHHERGDIKRSLRVDGYGMCAVIQREFEEVVREVILTRPAKRVKNENQCPSRKEWSSSEATVRRSRASG